MITVTIPEMEKMHLGTVPVLLKRGLLFLFHAPHAVTAIAAQSAALHDVNYLGYGVPASIGGSVLMARMKDNGMMTGIGYLAVVGAQAHLLQHHHLLLRLCHSRGRREMTGGRGMILTLDGVYPSD
jgi:hypothetical protein